MSTGTRTIVIVLAALAALCELFGTLTVFATYRRSAKLGDSIHSMLAREEYASQFGSETKRHLADMMQRWADPGDVRKVKDFSTNAIRELSMSLEPKWWISLGLWAYVAGAALGLAAAIVAVA
jgi:hypothetical protein